MKKKMMVLTGLLMAVAITAYSVSGTYAKYTSTFTGSSSATVAKWAFQVNGAAVSKDFTFNLFETILDSNSSAETDVAAKKIAPGTRGQFDISVANISEVTAQISMTANVTYAKLTDGEGNPINYTIPLEYSVNGTDWNTDINAVLSTLTENVAIGASSTSRTIQWRWAFDDDATPGVNDERDTALGILAANGTVPEITVELSITATQVD